VRNDPPSPYDGFDMDAARTSRIEGLRERAAKFAAEL